ncbi:telomeric repeat-binding factor 2 [Podarcis lilfordi]|uniref:Telomeric repeat-binding factor 2 n=1 Tax=Podarcis lilfordi TaxID=74358 RepID=A0AA35LDZ1_9SAUR|nr:telomeric repeat-binding factor 2 [Podarcis lilfordi]
MTKDSSSQKMRSMLQRIIQRKNLSHPAILNFSYKVFQQRILLSLESCWSVSEPFLLEMAKKDLDDQIETGLNPLEMASKEEMVKDTSELAAADKPESVGRSDETLEEPRPEGGLSNTVEEQPKSLEGGRETVARLLMEAKGAVLEVAKVVDECQAEEENHAAFRPHPSECSVSLSTLVMGSESGNLPTSCQVSSKRPAATLDVQTTQPQIPTQPDDTSQSPRLAKRRLICSDQNEEEDLPGGEEVHRDRDRPETLRDPRHLESKDKSSSSSRSSSSTSLLGSKKKIWTSEEPQWIKEGVKKFGEGRWKAICQAFPFKIRTPVAIKDRWRTVKNQGLLGNDLEASG